MTMTTCIATSFADPKDVASFKRCKLTGKTDDQCFALGDNGVGCWGDDTTVPFPMVALPPEAMREHAGGDSTRPCRGKIVMVRLAGDGPSHEWHAAEVRDRMPEPRYRKNGAGLDMNAELCRRLGVSIPAFVRVDWVWA